VTLLGAGVLALVVAWLWRSPAPVASAPPPPPASGPRQTASLPPEPDRDVRPPELPAQPPREGGAPAPVIDEITVEKSEVCEGEENLITVKAHTEDGTDRFLNYVIGDKQGQRVPVRSYLPDQGEEQVPRQVLVYGRGNVVTRAPMPAFVVKKCKPARSALITAHLRANTFSEFDFEVKVVESQPDPTGVNAFQPRSYEWSFGDGQTAVTDVPHVVHSYEDRKQDTLYSSVLIEVKVRGGSGEPVVGRHTLNLINPAFEDFATKGVVALQVQLTPRFPDLGSDGLVRQRVRVFHHRGRPVYVHNAVVFLHRTTPNQPASQNSVDPSALMGGSMIPPGRGLEFEARLDTNRFPDVFSEEFYLEGKDSDGNPARGAFSVMRPPPRPTKEKSDPVQDPVLKAKILAARKILNQQYVTDEDIWRLEREGKLANVQVPAQATQPERPPDRRDPPEKDPGPAPEGPMTPNGEGDAKPGDKTQKPPAR
jgi:hypothetical protein